MIGKLFFQDANGTLIGRTMLKRWNKHNPVGNIKVAIAFRNTLTVNPTRWWRWQIDQLQFATSRISDFR